MEKQELISAISKEIDFIQKNESRPGWTQWALLTAIAGLVWVLLKQIQQGSFDLNSISLLFFIGIIIWDTLIFFRAFFLKPKTSSVFSSNDSIKSRFTSPLESSLERGYFISFLIRAGFVVFLMFMIPVPLNIVLKSIILFYYLGFSFFIIFSVLYDFFDIPIPKKLPNKLTIRIFAGIFTGICIVFIISIYLVIVGLECQTTCINNIQTSFILLGILYLTSLYISIIYSSDLLLLALHNTERDLTFGHIDTESAKDQVDVILKGRKMNHLLQEYVNDIILLLEKKSEYEKKIVSLLTDAIERDYTSTIEDITDEVKYYLDKIKDIRDVQLVKKMNKLKLKRSIINIIDPDAKYNFSSLNDKFLELSEKSSVILKDIGEKLEKLEAKHSQHKLKDQQKEIVDVGGSS